MGQHRIFAIPFADIYPHYVGKAERKGRRCDEVDQVIAWLTGYDDAGLRPVIQDRTTLEEFFGQAPRGKKRASIMRGERPCRFRLAP